jgi:type III secretion protein V
MALVGVLSRLGSRLSRSSDVVLAAGIVGIVAMMIVPLPTVLLDLLLTVNITTAVILLLVAIYTGEAIRFSAFPTLLLVTTLFRLALNVSSTRLILLNGFAGEVIDSFGKFVVAGNYVVGGVVFLILTLIQFIVIAKGSERVAEVAARFTLDAMPGKQMAIDADLRAGAIDLDEARRRRQLLQRESQLYGAMDGAMKFVKGDAIAGIIITVINIGGGLLIGVLQRGMSVKDAAQTYTLLTIGDGLVTQIPALLVSTAAGMIVTRVAAEDPERHLGEEVSGQVLAHPKALGIAAALLIGLALIPGLPTFPFLVLASLCGMTSYGLLRARRRAAPRLTVAGEADAGLLGFGGLASLVGLGGEAPPPASRPAPLPVEALAPLVVPLGLDLAPELARTAGAEREDGTLLAELIPAMREAIFHELGVVLPGVRVRTDPGLAPASDGLAGGAAGGGDGAAAALGYVILLNELPLARGQLPAGTVLCAESPERLMLLGILARPADYVGPGPGPQLLQKGATIAAADRTAAEDAGVRVWDAGAALILHLSTVVRSRAHDLLGLEEVQRLLDRLEPTHPALVREVVPKLVSLQLLTDVLRRLVEEGVGIRNLPAVLGALAEMAPHERDPVMLTEHVRVALKRQISFRFAAGQSTLAVYLLDAPIEDAIRGAIQRVAGGSYLALEPELAQDIIRSVRAEIGTPPPTAQPPVILTTMELRRFVRKLLEVELPGLSVLSYQELSPDLTVQPLGRIAIG